VRFKVYLLRYRGRRLPWREVHNGRTYVGHLITHYVTLGEERYAVTSLQPEDPVGTAPIPPLYEAVLLGFSTLAFRLRGFERVERGKETYAVVQEWHCELP
jgi:hypothetical protein